MRKFTIIGTIQVEHHEAVTAFLEHMGWNEADGTVADAIRSEMLANLGDVFDSGITLIVLESHDPTDERAVTTISGDGEGNVHRHVEPR